MVEGGGLKIELPHVIDTERFVARRATSLSSLDTRIQTAFAEGVHASHQHVGLQVYPARAAI